LKGIGLNTRGVVAMRDEDEIQEMADKAADKLKKPDPDRANNYYIEGLRDALDWVLDEDAEAPL
jgi:hypothetical protein